MAIKKINVGYLANDGTGDDLREAFIKVNDNFEEMQYILDQAVRTEAENLGSGAPIFKEKLGNVFKFKTIQQGANVLLTQYGDSITITSDAGLQSITFLTDAGSAILDGGDRHIYFQGGRNIGTVVANENGNNYIRTNVIGEGLLFLDKDPHLGGTLIGNNNEITDVHKITSNTFAGNLEGLVYGIDVRNLNNIINQLEFGDFNYTINSLLDYIIFVSTVDFGTFDAPAVVNYDPGVF
jgi:hypothetical protein